MPPRSPPLLVLEPQRIDLWCAFLADLDAARCWGECATLLNVPERRRARTLRRPADRRRHLAARALVRTVLSRYLPVAPREWVFDPDAHGRPRIVAPQGLPPLEFNIAHSGGVVMLGVTAGSALGVDVELPRRRTDTVGLERYFAPRERSALAALPPAQRRGRFFELWTLKESYLKARGLGLRLPLDGLTFEPQTSGGIELSFTDAIADSPQRWVLAQLRLRGRYVAAVCAERAGSRATTLAVYETVPFGQTRAMSPPLLRARGMHISSVR